MSAKPATTPVWNTNAGGMTTPSAGQQSDGSAPGDILASGIFDFLIYWICQWIAYLSGGVIQHTTKTRSIPAASMTPDNGASAAFTNGAWLTSANGDIIRVPVILDVGERIKGWRVRVADAATGTLTAQLVSRANATGGTSNVGGSASSNNSTTDQTLSVSGLTTQIASGTSYHITITQAGAGLIGGIAWAEVDYDRVTS